LWVIVNGRMESVDIDVPRIIYLNSTVPDPNEHVIRPGLEMTKRVRTLPRNHTCLHLYELRMTEYYYRTHANIFSGMFNHKDVEGVYETQVPLLVRALIHLGLFAKLNIPIEMFDKTRPTPLDHLSVVKKPTNFYLPVGSFDIIYLFHAFAGPRHLIGTFQPASAVVQLFIVDPGKNLDQLPTVRRSYAEFYDARDTSLDSDAYFNYPSSIDPKSAMFATEGEALDALNDHLLRTKDSSNKPIVLLVQSSTSIPYYRKSGVVAFRECPSMAIPTHKADNDFPSLGWQQYAVSRMMNNCFNLVPFLKDRIDIARYGNVPLCNVETDYILFISDLILARRLKDSDSLLWCSSSSKPDLGGSEQEDYSSSYADFKFPEVNNPGAYETMTIALDLFDLPLNTLIRSVEFKGDLDNVTTLSNKASIHLLDSHIGLKDSKVIARADYTEVENPHSALSFIRTMIKDWLIELRKHNAFASTFLDHLHRWISSPSSLMHDPMIVSYIHNLMKRSFAQLLEELQRLGSQVIYATFNKIVLKTSKTNIQSSIGYIHYVIAAISKNSSFEHVELKPVGFWDYLFWFDSFNYGGIAYQIEEGNMVGDPIPDFRFNIGDYLPPLVQNVYLQTIAEYLYVVQQAKQNPQSFHGTLQSYVDSALKRKLLQQVDDFHHRRVPDENLEDNPYQFPHLPGMNKQFHNAALEFIKSIIVILRLDVHLENQVRSLNRDLLRLIDIREFQGDAVFSTPCEKYVLHQVICEYCNYCCDLDLTCKISLSDSFLSCRACNMQYNKDEVELLLIAETQKIISKWQLQDIKCASCKLIRAEELSAVCARCTGKIETVYKKDKFKIMLNVLGNIANFYRMENLQEYCDFILRLGLK
jgi:DNA polymerase epsilon subunit 1